MAKALKRFLVSSSLGDLSGKCGRETKSVLLTPKETHHLKNVLRIKEGSLCLLFDREGNEFLSCLKRFLPDQSSEAELLEPVLPQEDGLRLTVAQAIPQDRKMDDIAEKSAEIGVFELIPLLTKHTVPRIQADKFEKIRARWKRIAEQTLKQSKLSRVPEILPLTTFSELCIRSAQYDQAFLCHPSPEAKPFRELGFNQNQGPAHRILLAIGPEGGFSPQEVEQAKCAGMQMIKMGRGILKTDTAFVAASSFFRLMYS